MAEGEAELDWHRAKARQIDAELRGLGRGDGRLRLALGEALEAMLRTQGHHALGFSSIEAYARERCGLGTGQVRQLRTVARRLAELPRLRGALMEGQVGFSMAELVSRHVTPDSEPFLVALAQRTPVARMRELFREKKLAQKNPHSSVHARQCTTSAGSSPCADPHRTSSTALAGSGARTRHLPHPDDPDLDSGDFSGPAAATRGHLARTVDPRTAWLFEQTRLFVEAHCGSRANDAVFEALLGEATTELLDHLEGEPRPVEHEGDLPPGDTPIAPMAAQQRRCRAAGSDESTNAPGPTDPTELDRRCVELSRQLARRDLQLAELTLDLRWLGGFGCSEAEYAEQVLGMSHSALKSKQTLLRRLSRLPELHHALEDGLVGLEAAGLIARVATQASVEAWVNRASRRTVKHLKEEIRFVEMVANLTGGAPAGPPTAEQMAHLHEVERGVLSGVVESDNDGSQISTPVQEAMADDPTAVSPRKMGRVRKRFRLRADLAHEYRRLEHAWDRAGQPDDDFMRFLCLAFWRAWGHIFDEDQVQYEEIYQRERYQCASPTCERRDLTPHHLIFRSQGGGDEPGNVVGLCTSCHLHGIHTVGSIKAEPPATHMTWKTPVLEVHGREVVWRRRMG